MSCKYCSIEENFDCDICKVGCCIHCGKQCGGEWKCKNCDNYGEKIGRGVKPGDELVNFGKYQGKPFKKVPVQYLIAQMNNERISKFDQDKFWKEYKRRRDKRKNKTRK